MIAFESNSTLSQLPSLKALARDLRRRRPSLHPDAQPHASNLIEQLDFIETPADLERLRPFMARAAGMLLGGR